MMRRGLWVLMGCRVIKRTVVGELVGDEHLLEADEVRVGERVPPRRPLHPLGRRGGALHAAEHVRLSVDVGGRFVHGGVAAAHQPRPLPPGDVVEGHEGVELAHLSREGEGERGR